MYTLTADAAADKLPAASLSAEQRAQLATAALIPGSISPLSRQTGTSRKFIRRQRDKARAAIHQAFEPLPDDAEVLFYLPVTKAWLCQFVLVLVFTCRASYRRVQDAMSCLLDTSISLGSIHNLLAATHTAVRALHRTEDLAAIRIGAHDEIFHHNKPVLAGVDVETGYCYELGDYGSCDGDTWALVLMELQDRGLDLDHAIADFGKGLRAGYERALPGVPLWGDHHHILAPLTELVGYLESKAYKAIERTEAIEKKMARARARGQGQKHSRNLGHKRQQARDAIELADDVRVLVRWLRWDVLRLCGPDASTRLNLWEFITAELRARSHRSKRVKSVVRLLETVRDEALLFAHHLDKTLAVIADEHGVDVWWVRCVVECEGLKPDSQRYFEREGELRAVLGHKYRAIHEAVLEALRSVKRGSGDVENLNGQLRKYFELRRVLGDKWLEMLRFYLNHHRQGRSRRPGGSGKSPAERLKGRRLPHWLEQLGYQLFKTAA